MIYGDSLQVGKWRLHPSLMEHVWTQFGKAEVNLIANTAIPSVVALVPPCTTKSPPRLDICACAYAPCPDRLLYHIMLILLIPLLLERMRLAYVSVILVKNCF